LDFALKALVDLFLKDWQILGLAADRNALRCVMLKPLDDCFFLTYFKTKQ
jgi:hypothetical protein